MSQTISLADQLLAHRKKRQALEQLISFARQITTSGDSMEALQFAARPSQKAEKGRMSFLLEMTSHLQEIDTNTLKERLMQIDKLLIAEIELFLHIAGLSEEDFIDLHHSSDAADFQQQIDALQKRLQAFKRKAQTNVAIRLVLLERGVQLHALKLPISQEFLSQQVMDLRKKESQCKEKIVRDIKTLMAETNHILNHHKNPQRMVDKLWETQEHLQSTLTHIESGKSIEDLPFTIDAHMEIDLLPIASDATPLAEEPPVEMAENDSARTENKGKKGFFRTLDTWLNSSADVSWEEAKQQRSSQTTRH